MPPSIDWGYWGKIATILAGILLAVWAQRQAVQGELKREVETGDAEQWI